MNVAPWLQAFAAVVVAVLTYHLVKATREYVRLTHELAQAARAQQEDQASQRAADHDYLGALVEQLREKARALPEGTATASVQRPIQPSRLLPVRRHSVWDDIRTAADARRRPRRACVGGCVARLTPAPSTA